MTDEYQIDNVTWAEKDSNGNIVVDPDALDANELFAGPAGAIISKTTTQDIESGFLDSITYDNSKELNPQADEFADLANNQITIPNDKYTKVRTTAQIYLTDSEPFDFCDIQRNGVSLPFQTQTENLENSNRVFLQSPWVDASSGDSFSVRVQHKSGTTETLDDAERNWLQVEAV